MCKYIESNSTEYHDLQNYNLIFDLIYFRYINTRLTIPDIK